MNTQVPEKLLSRLADFVRASTGLFFPPDQWPDLRRGLLYVAGELGFDDAESCINWLLSPPSNQEKIDVLAFGLTVGETFFFRDKALFQALEHQVLPEILRARQKERKLAIWSAGCCTGEEPYSLAIMLDRWMAGLPGWGVSILATDLNPRFLDKAKKGVYSSWSFRDTPAELKESYFTPEGDNRFSISPRIRDKIRFSRLNLVEPSASPDSEPAGFDLVLCRNVLMYFESKKRDQAIRRLIHALAVGGFLVVSPSESAFVRFPELSGFGMPAIFRKAPPQRTPGILVKTDFPQPIPAVSKIAPPGAVAFRASPSPRQAPVPEGGKPADPSPQGPEEMARTARQLADRGDLEQAGRWCDRAIGADRSNPSHCYLMAAICQEAGNPDEAIRWLKRTIYLAPDFVMAHFVLGDIARRRNRGKEAGKHLENALSLLAARSPGEVVPFSGGMTTGSFIDTIRAMIG